MKHFTIDEENNITVYASRKAARDKGAGVFATEEQLADLIGLDSPPHSPATPPFTTRATATRMLPLPSGRRRLGLTADNAFSIANRRLWTSLRVAARGSAAARYRLTSSYYAPDPRSPRDSPRARPTFRTLVLNL